MMKLLWENSEQLKAVNYFPEKVPSLMFDRFFFEILISKVYWREEFNP